MLGLTAEEHDRGRRLRLLLIERTRWCVLLLGLVTIGVLSTPGLPYIVDRARPTEVAGSVAGVAHETMLRLIVVNGSWEHLNLAACSV